MLAKLVSNAIGADPTHKGGRSQRRARHPQAYASRARVFDVAFEQGENCAAGDLEQLTDESHKMKESQTNSMRALIDFKVRSVAVEMRCQTKDDDERAGGANGRVEHRARTLRDHSAANHRVQGNSLPQYSTRTHVTQHCRLHWLRCERGL